MTTTPNRDILRGQGYDVSDASDDSTTRMGWTALTIAVLPTGPNTLFCTQHGWGLEMTQHNTCMYSVKAKIDKPASSCVLYVVVPTCTRA